MDGVFGQQSRPLRRVEYDQLVSLGAFEDERIELLDGVLVPMSPIGPSHSSTVQRLVQLILPPLLGRAQVRCQLPFAALDVSEPEPDIAVVPIGDYDSARPDHAHLIIEVSESSLVRDRGVKCRLYAACGVPEYWIVNLVDRQIEVYADLADSAYRALTTYVKGQAIRVQQFPDLVIQVADAIH